MNSKISAILRFIKVPGFWHPNLLCDTVEQFCASWSIVYPCLSRYKLMICSVYQLPIVPDWCRISQPSTVWLCFTVPESTEVRMQWRPKTSCSDELCRCHTLMLLVASDQLI
jgi:hypothetical protein